MTMLKHNFFKLSLLTFLLIIAFNIQAYAENQPAPLENAVRAENSSNKLKLKAPIVDEMSDEERKKATEDAKIKEELIEAQKSMTETDAIKIEDKDFDPVSNDSLAKEIVPNTGSELFKIITLFAKVMIGVILSAFVIYILLLFTKKFFHPPLPSRGEEDFDIRDLNSPKSADEALKAFLDRTDD